MEKYLDKTLNIQDTGKKFLNEIERKYFISRNNISPFSDFSKYRNATVKTSSTVKFAVSQLEQDRAGI